jgi:hypothetical protein
MRLGNEGLVGGGKPVGWDGVRRRGGWLGHLRVPSCPEVTPMLWDRSSSHTGHSIEPAGTASTSSAGPCTCEHVEAKRMFRKVPSKSRHQLPNFSCETSRMVPVM